MIDTIYIKETEDYSEVVKFKKISFLKRIIFWYKNLFNIVTIKKVDDIKIWILPIKNNKQVEKTERILKKQFKKKYIIENTKLVISKNLKSKELINMLNKYEIKYVDGNLAKKMLIFKVLDYINNLQHKKLNEREITILVNETSDTNINLITKLAFESKNIKIVSRNINQFKNLEEKLYNENGIALQFSNSYKKSLKKSELIINLDFSEIEINEYDINSQAIIINTENKLRIKSRLFNGIIVNSYKIKYLDPLKDYLMKFGLLEKFENLEIYESLLYNSNNYLLNENNIKILKLVGNNGIIIEKEFKNIS